MNQYKYMGAVGTGLRNYNWGDGKGVSVCLLFLVLWTDEEFFKNYWVGGRVWKLVAVVNGEGLEGLIKFALALNVSNVFMSSAYAKLGGKGEILRLADFSEYTFTISLLQLDVIFL